MDKPRRLITWIVVIWAVISGCLVSDLFVCPWTDVFPY